eukprot:TRINITY_DN74_c0_g1_i7.p1 TRINITY_DN74_c0_g1~~TRINITY_DN74_c0_g1_i7.p1  ORF type:complete len:1319 (+),score=617.48 TRINITY_DN74_c0_g1_i7:100-3957(+)
MPTEPKPEKRPSELEKNVLGKAAKGGELVKKTKTTDLVEDICYKAAGQDVSDLHNMTIEDEFAGKVFPRAEYRGQVRNLRNGNPNWVNIEHPEQSNGLTNAQRAELMDVYGENALTPPDEKSELQKFVEQFTGFFSLLLIVGGLLCMIAYGADTEGTENLFLGLVLFIVVTITAIFTYQQESASADMMKKFQKIGATKQAVTIEGQTKTIEVTEIVPGDVFRLNNEVRPPCDARILKASNDFAVIEASLTGEPDAIKKGPKTSEKPDERALNQKNIVVAGTEITAGEAWCMAIATGDQTVMGRNFALMLDTKALKDDTPIRKEIDRFVEIISAIAIALGVVFLIVNIMVVGVSVEAIVFTIGIIVANVPEGLLATVTVSLALTAARMKDVMVLVKNLEAVETLGSTSVICSDKTGTLTQGRMTAVKAFVSGKLLTTYPMATASWGAHPPKTMNSTGFYELQKCATFCGSAVFKAPEDKAGLGGAPSIPWEKLAWDDREMVNGDPSEKAILVFNEQRLAQFENDGINGMSKYEVDSSAKTNSFLPVSFNSMKDCLLPKEGSSGWDNENICKNSSRVAAARREYPCIDRLPFDSKNKWMAMTTDMTKVAKDGENFVTWIKGGSDVVFDFCTHTYHGDQIGELAPEDRREFAENNVMLASQGLRVFAFAKVVVDTLKNKGAPANAAAYFGESMLKPDNWAPGEMNEEGKVMEAGTPKPITVAGKPQIPLVRPDIAARRMKETGDSEHYFVPKVVFLGLLAMQDPPRPAVPRAVQICRQASIGVVMVTGDQPTTAAAIARDIGIITAAGKTEDDVVMEKLKSEPGKSLADFKTDRERVLNSLKTEEKDSISAMAVEGSRISKWNPKAMDSNWTKALGYCWKEGLVFARTSPTQKLLIVQHFRIKESEGGPEKIVAVTGDGANDAQAVTAADIGICMGIAGVEVTREAADMVLMNDNFASIVDGVLEGRLIFDNLKKSIAYTLSSNIPEISPFIVFILLRVPLPLTTVLILCVDLGTDMVPAISLAYETKEKDIMKRAPRTKTDNLVTERLISFSYFQIGVIQALAGFFSFFSVMYSEGYAPEDLPGSGELAGYFTPGGPPFGGFSVQENLKSQSMAQTAFFCSIVIVQWADILICKTRRLSLFDQGMKNDQLNFGLFFETALACFLIYVPGVSVIFGMQKLRFVYWLPAIPFSILIFTYDETRKWIIRHHDDVLDFFRWQKEKGLMRNEYNEQLYWEGYAQEGAGKDWPTDEDWTEEEKKAHQQKTESLSKAAKRIEKAARWLDRFSYW